MKELNLWEHVIEVIPAPVAVLFSLGSKASFNLSLLYETGTTFLSVFALCPVLPARHVSSEKRLLVCEFWWDLLSCSPEIEDKVFNGDLVVPTCPVTTDFSRSYPVSYGGSPDPQQRGDFCDGEFLWSCHCGEAFLVIVLA